MGLFPTLSKQSAALSCQQLAPGRDREGAVSRRFFQALLAVACLGASALLGSESGLSARFDLASGVWTLANGQVSVVFELNPQGHFRFVSLTHLAEGKQWRTAGAAPVAPFDLMLEDRPLDGFGPYRLVSQSASPVDRGGLRQTIVLDHLELPARVRFEAEVYPDQPVLRYRSWVENRDRRPLWFTEARMVNWRFDDAGRSYRAFRVNQWVREGKDGNFEPLDSAVTPGGTAVEVFSGAHGQHCAWLVARDNVNRGIFLGWEFDGRARIHLRHTRLGGALEISGGPIELFHPVNPAQEFLVPGAFLGVFRGDWDEASYRTHRFTEAVLAYPLPDDEKFPYIMWDSWGYDQNINEELIRRAARNAARLGIEVIVLDLGWARAVGDWRPDPAKFPSGLKALSDYVHSLGMKFGLHFPFAEASPSAPIMRQNPDWFATDNTGYYGARPLCLSHRPVKQWIIAEAVRMINEYGVDWILQDGENMVKRCTKRTHTHDPADSNYSNSVEGLNAVVDAIQRAAPHVLWENVEDGGNMMTFNMVQRYVTSIAADNADILTTRQATYGVTYPFPPRYSDRYMQDDEMNGYIARSYMFGGPWIFMNKIADWTERQIENAAIHVNLYKQLRQSIRDGRVFHLGQRPAETRSDAIQSYDPAADTSVIFVYRVESPLTSRLVRPRGLNPDQLYRVRFEDSPEQYLATGSALVRDGIRVALPDVRTSDIVHIEPAGPTQIIRTDQVLK